MLPERAGGRGAGYYCCSGVHSTLNGCPDILELNAADSGLHPFFSSPGGDIIDFRDVLLVYGTPVVLLCFVFTKYDRIYSSDHYWPLSTAIKSYKTWPKAVIEHWNVRCAIQWQSP